MPARRRIALAAAAAAVGVTVLGGPVTPAQATAYRYWTYWTAPQGAWVFASTGPAYRVPADGSVEGWRFAVSTEAGGDRPRADAATAFAQLCGATPAEEGRKRVAVVLDTGDPADAPAGETPPPPRGACVVAAADATGYAVLRSAATVRVDDGLVCAIDGYPAQGCADVVDDPAPGPTRTAAVPDRDPPAPTPSRPAGTRPAAPPATDGPDAPAAQEPADTGAPAGATDPAVPADPGGGADPAADPAADPTAAPPTAGTLAFPAEPAPGAPAAEQSPIALAAGTAPPPSDPGSPVALVLVVAGAGILGLAAWARTRRARP